MPVLGPLVRVLSVEPQQDFAVRCTFDNGVMKTVDLEPYMRGPIFEPLRNDPVSFRAMRVEGGTIAWDNGADVDPDVLYYGLKPAWADEPGSVPAQPSRRRSG